MIEEKMMRLMYLLAVLLNLNRTIFANSPSRISKEHNLEFLAQESASQGYDRNFIALVEMIYGSGFLSQGGRASVQSMVEGLHLNGCKILDIGSGLGGPCLYLAEQYDCEITGLEPQEWMVKKAQMNLHAAKDMLKGSIEFILMQAASNLQQFEEASFDVILSKEALLHLPLSAKEGFFAEIHRVLKPNGALVIMDWMRGSLDYSENTKKMMEQDGVAYHLIFCDKYLEFLRQAGFSEVTVQDITADHAIFSQQNVDRIQDLKSMIDSLYGEQVFWQSIDSWNWQRDAFKSRELLVGVFRARKTKTVANLLDRLTTP